MGAGFHEETLMPELPEVETMVRGLRPALLGRLVERIEVHDPFLLQGCDAEEFESRGRMVQVEEVARRGKWVALTLSHHRGMIVIQPRMTGGFWLIQPPRSEHIRLTFRLRNPRQGSGTATHGGWARFNGSPAPSTPPWLSPGRTARMLWRSGSRI